VSGSWCSALNGLQKGLGTRTGTRLELMHCSLVKQSRVQSLFELTNSKPTKLAL